MSDRPIIFSAPMVRALLYGRKTQTRRLAWNGPKVLQDGTIVIRGSLKVKPTVWQSVQPGDRLWVRESIRYEWARGGGAWILPADDVGLLGVVGRTLETPTHDRWPTGSCPSIHMPRWASRITLTVTEVRIERLQMIRDADAVAEGVAQWVAEREGHGAPADEALVRAIYHRPHMAFQHLWETIHGAASWDDNPAVVALTFTVARRNIDAKEPLRCIDCGAPLHEGVMKLCQSCEDAHLKGEGDECAIYARADGLARRAGHARGDDR